MGMSQALNGLALLVRDPARPVPRPGIVRLRVPDWLPALVNAGRAFVTIGAVALFWIVTAWPNGAGAIIWAAVSVILLSPRADQAYAAALRFAVGNAPGGGLRCDPGVRRASSAGNVRGVQHRPRRCIWSLSAL